jgi:Ferritin-like
MSPTESTWTKELVQQHAQAAVSVEIYTLPFYLTALTSIKDTSSPSYVATLGVCMEEMLHLELAANLCLALGTTPNFTAPQYGTPIPFFDPDDPETGHYALINAVLGPLNETTLQTMLDIETPEEFETADNSTPQYPYDSIGAMYQALLDGIQAVEASGVQFPWTTTNQQAVWSPPPQAFPEVITNFTDATNAVNTITEQGEGKTMSPVPSKPYTEQDFPIPSQYQLANEQFDPAPGNTYSHFGRFVSIQNATLPDVYSGASSPTTPAQTAALSTLQKDFSSFIDNLNATWAGSAQLDFGTMMGLLGDAVACWQAGVIPQWSA